MVPKINLEKLEDKHGKKIEGPLELVNQSVSHNLRDGEKEDDKNQISLEMDENPDTSRAQNSMYNQTEHKAGVKKHRPRRKNEKRLVARQKQSAEDSVVLNEILSNYGNQSKIKEILEKNKQAKKRMRESDAVINLSKNNGQSADSDHKLGKPPVVPFKKPYTRSRKTQVCEVDLGIQVNVETRQKLREKRKHEQELKQELKNKEKQLEVEKQLNLSLNASLIEHKDTRSQYERELRKQTIALQE